MLFGRKWADFDATDGEKIANKFQSIDFQEIIVLKLWRPALKGTSSFSRMFLKSIFFTQKTLNKNTLFCNKKSIHILPVF
eukprot:UN22093